MLLAAALDECWPYVPAYPTNSALFINFLLSSDAEIFVTKHSTELASRRPKVQKACTQRVHVPTEPPFLHATVGGWAESNFACSCKTKIDEKCEDTPITKVRRKGGKRGLRVDAWEGTNQLFPPFFSSPLPPLPLPLSFPLLLLLLLWGCLSVFK